MSWDDIKIFCITIYSEFPKYFKMELCVWLSAYFPLLPLCAGKLAQLMCGVLKVPMQPRGIFSLCAHKVKEQLMKVGNGALETLASD